MTGKRWQEIERLYHSALKQEPSKRAPFLEEACGGDEALRQEVESLLARNVEAEDFIEEPALNVAAKGMARKSTESIVGRQFGPYQILSLLGAGGMGEVYRARDNRLGREVAIKVLHSEFSEDADRVGRFKQEARAAGQLNHPNILAIYDVGTYEGSPYLVSELLEGETLRDRLRQALSQRKALEYAGQIARGLAAAHEKGIVHRDLKPENLFITRSDGVKILDFGLAKLTQRKLDASQLTTATTNPVTTEPGVVMGTVGYMSPEQVRGEVADHRSDIFAFGAILYQMLSGKRAFQGNSTVETMHAILNQEPPALTEINGSISPALERIVRHCLEKRPEERYQSARDIAFNLEALSGLSDSNVAPLTVAARRSKSRERLAWIVAAIFFLAVLGFAVAYFDRAPTEGRSTRFTIPPPEKTSFGEVSLSISPNGHHLAFSTIDAAGKILMWVRSLDSLSARPLPGGSDGLLPFWSPDSRFLGFFAKGKLKKLALASGSPQTLCESPDLWGGTWNRDGVILFAPNFYGPLHRVSAAGGEAEPVTALDPSRQENAHLFPQFLPDGRHFLYLARSAQKQNTGIYVGSLDSKDTRRLVSTEFNAAYAPPGYLLFVREGMLMAQRFDPKELQLTGEPFPIVQRVGRFMNLYAFFSVSENGVLVYWDGVQNKNSQLVWLDRGGKQLKSFGSPGFYRTPWLSPDETRVAVQHLDPQTGKADIWLLDLLRGTSSRFTFAPSDDGFPIWSPDGTRIIFVSQREGSYTLYQKSSSGVGGEEVLLQQNDFMRPEDWFPDGRFIVYTTMAANNPKNFTDLWVLPLFGERKPTPYLQAESWEAQARFSPDGRWIAYQSTESGRPEVYVQSFPASSAKVPVSTQGGADPRWRRDGKELFYLATDHKMMAVEVKTSSTFKAGVPRALFQARVMDLYDSYKHYTVTKDGQRFLIVTAADEVTSDPITVVLNWVEELKH